MLGSFLFTIREHCVFLVVCNCLCLFSSSLSNPLMLVKLLYISCFLVGLQVCQWFHLLFLVTFLPCSLNFSKIKIAHCVCIMFQISLQIVFPEEGYYWLIESQQWDYVWQRSHSQKRAEYYVEITSMQRISTSFSVQET